MYTRCPHCRTLYRVTAAALAQAGGEVRCGRCGADFDALPSLTDVAPPGTPDADNGSGRPAIAGPAAPPPLPPEPVAVPEVDAATTDAGTAPMPALPAAGGEAPLDFDVPEGDWHQFFDDAHGLGADGDERPTVEPEFEVQPVVASAAPEAVAEPPAPEVAAEEEEPAPITSLEDETSDTDTWQAFLREVPGDEEEEEEEGPVYVIRGDDEQITVATTELPAGATQAEPGPGGEAEPPAFPADTLDEVLVVETEDPEGESLVPTELLRGYEPPEDGDERGEPPLQSAPEGRVAPVPPVAAARLRPRVVDEEPDPILHWKGAPSVADAPPRRTGWWLAASLLLLATLGAQAVFGNRDTLAADPRFGPTLRSVAERLQLPLYPAWPLGAYELRGAEAIAGRTASGALDIVGDVAVVGSQPVGLPMIRVVLRDRWSNVIGTRLVAPADYLASGSRALAQPGTVIPVQISLADPGPGAQGYELDVCVPDRYRGLLCQQSRDPFQR